MFKIEGLPSLLHA